jgi:hypothetical protein
MNGLNTFKYFFVSYGGVGAHLMLDIFKYVEMIDYNNFQKHHIRIPPKTFGQNTKLVYLSGDPYNAILSYFRRRDQEYKTWTVIVTGKHTNLVFCPNVLGGIRIWCF